MEDIRETLNRHVRSRHYNLAAIARAANLTPTKFQGILNKTRRLEANELFDICTAIGITPDSLREEAEISSKIEA